LSARGLDRIDQFDHQTVFLATFGDRHCDTHRRTVVDPRMIRDREDDGDRPAGIKQTRK
jgi:hypothetical protein